MQEQHRFPLSGPCRTWADLLEEVKERERERETEGEEGRRRERERETERETETGRKEALAEHTEIVIGGVEEGMPLAEAASTY